MKSFPTSMKLLFYNKMDNKDVEPPKKSLLDQVDKKKIMEHAFSLLKKQGKNTAEGIVTYLKERKLLDDGTEKVVRQLFSGVSDPKNIDCSKFTEACESVAKDKGLDMANISKSVAKSLFGGGRASGKASTGVSDPSTSAETGPTEEYDGNNESSDSYYESFDEHPPSHDHQESDDDQPDTDDHHESDHDQPDTDDHHESDHDQPDTDDHHESTD